MHTGFGRSATLRHVGLVALEALLVASLIGFGAMLLAGINDSHGGIVGSADARGKANLTIADGVFGGTTVAHANPGGAGTWIHVTCTQSGQVVETQWSPVDANNEAVIGLGPTPSWSGGGASCVGEEGYFSNGRYHVQDKTAFTVAA